FMGTPDFAVPTFTAVAGQRPHRAARSTRAPPPAGRGPGGRAHPRGGAARGVGSSVRTPGTLRAPGGAGAVCSPLAAAAPEGGRGADGAGVVAYGLILPKPILDAPRLGCFNLHASALPRWRGAAPINRAIMAGDAETGVVVMQMAEGLDTGPMAMAAHVAIRPN